MVNISDQRMPNLLSYKYFVLKSASERYGDSQSKSKHHQNVQNILKILALNGPMTTWEMAKVKFATDNHKIRTKEKEYRRLLVGRTDRGKHSEGILDLNLILIDSKSTKRNPGNRYRLSLFGILFSLNVLDLSNDEIDQMAKNYESILPKIFGKWDFLKKMTGENVYNLKLLGKGLLFDNPNIIDVKNSKFFELISYFNIKSNSLSQSMNEEIMGDMISYWYFITLLYLPDLHAKRKSEKTKGMLNQVLNNDKSIQSWFMSFLSEAQKFYNERAQTLQKISVDNI